MSGRAAVAIIVSLGLALAGCSPAPPPAPPPKPAAAAPAPPAKVGRMICRSSVDGRSVKCGTPNAVMVGMTFD